MAGALAGPAAPGHAPFDKLRTCFHVIFTVANQLHILWRWNRKVFADARFQAARDALFELLAEERHLGAHPGLALALHTWGSALPVNPHA